MEATLEALNAVSVRPIEAGDEARWRALWAGYCAFYEVTLSTDITDHTWARISNPQSPVQACVAVDATGEVIGICNYILHENTWTPTQVCYLEDLNLQAFCF